METAGYLSSILIGVALGLIGGIFVGFALSKWINGGKLKPAFGWFTAAMSVFIILREIIR